MVEFIFVQVKVMLWGMQCLNDCIINHNNVSLTTIKADMMFTLMILLNDEQA